MCSEASNSSAEPGEMYGNGRCGLNCWLAKYPDPEDVEEWYAQHKNLTEDTETWYARQPTFDFEGWYRNNSNINHFDWPKWLRDHVSAKLFERKEANHGATGQLTV
jgi:hypothetical protein